MICFFVSTRRIFCLPFTRVKLSTLPLANAEDIFSFSQILDIFQSLDEADTMITPVLHDDIIPLATKKVVSNFIR